MPHPTVHPPRPTGLRRAGSGHARVGGLLAALALLSCEPKPPAPHVDPEVALPVLRRVRIAEQPAAIELRVEYAPVTLDGNAAFLRTYNGQLVGPTLRARPGETLRVKLVNALPVDPEDAGMDMGHHSHGAPEAGAAAVPMNTPHGFNVTNLHTHGLHVRPDVPERCAADPAACDAVSDNVLIDVLPGQSQMYEIAIPADHPPGTYWYHAHRHGSVSMQLASGMAGFLIIEGGLDDLPEIKNAPEQLLAFQQLRLTTCGRGKVGAGEGDARCANGTAPDQTFYETCDSYFSRLVKEGALPSFPAGSQCVENFDFIFGARKLTNVLQPLFNYRTSINGQTMPTIDMKAGELQRWRTLHAGVMESIVLGLVSVEDAASQQGADALTAGAAKRVPLNVVAYDGIATGRMDTVDNLELESGYRADLLVRVDKPGDYLLIDLATPATASLLADAEPYNVLARVRVAASTAEPTPLPSPAALAPLAPFRHVEDAEVKGCQYATFNFGHADPADPTSATTFLVNDKAFDMAHPPRTMTLGTAEEWVVNSGTANHPFHIHINAFELQEDYGPFKAGTWKDTLLVKQGLPFKIRTRYEDFTGDFVLHCHILNHEDQGMMQVVSVVPPGVADSACPISTTPGEPLCLNVPREDGACTPPSP